MVDKKSKTPGVIINQIRAAILDGLYKPGDRLLEGDLAEKFHVSRSPRRLSDQFSGKCFGNWTIE